MLDMNEIILHNIHTFMRKKSMKQVDLASLIHVSKQTLSKMLSGDRIINAVELTAIAQAMEVSIEELVRIPASQNEVNVIRAFMGEVKTPEAKRGLEIADEIIDFICFHAQSLENGEKMMQPWES